jgi:hypothetical protein
MHEYAENQHFKLYKVDELIPCLNLVCEKGGVVFSGYKHFKNYVATAHKSFLFEKHRA